MLYRQSCLGRWGLTLTRVSALAAFAALVFFAFFYGLGSYALLNDNEGLYAEIAREMLDNHAYVIPTLDYVPYIEKPPLLYWLVALSYRLFGVSEFSARLVPAAAATLVVASAWHFGYRIGRARAGFIASVIIASSFGFVLIARTLIFDMLLTACVALALLCFYRWYREDSSTALRASAFFLGLGVLAKGLVALALVALTIAIFLALMRAPWSRWRNLFDPYAVAIFLVVAVPWHVAAALTHPGFIWFYFVNEHWLRFLGMRWPADFHSGPFYYYVPLVLIGLLPWTAWLLRPLPGSAREPLEKFLWTWFVTFFVFFSCSQAKAGYYLVTALPALAFLAALQIERSVQERRWLRIKIIGAVNLAAAVFVVAGGIQPYRELMRDISGVNIGLLSFFTIATAAIVALTFVWRVSSRSWLSTMAPAAVTAPLVLLLVSSAAAVRDRVSAVDIAREIDAHDSARPVYLYRDFEELSALPFYLRRQVPIVDSASRDLAYASRRDGAESSFVSGADFRARAVDGPVYVVTRARRDAEFQRRFGGLIFCRIGGNRDAYVYSNALADCAGALPLARGNSINDGAAARAESGEAD